MKARSQLLSPSREQEIAELAESIAEEYFPAGKIDPVGIIEAKRITISFGQYGESFDGLLEHRDGRFHIYSNLDRVERPDTSRGRFTLGHELGHFFIDEHRNVLESGFAPAHRSFCEYESDLQVEREADHFSSNLLMPTGRFNKLAAKAPKGLEGILKLAGEFGTSVTSTAIRYAKSEFIPCAVIKWHNDGFGWKWLSTETFRARYRKTLETVDELPPDCPTARAMAGENPPAEGFFWAGSTAATWLPYVSDSGSMNSILMEHAVSLGRFGVLTFLYPESGSY